MVIELRVVQFWSEIILVISNRTRAARSFDFEITRMISDQIALHSLQLPLFINPRTQLRPLVMKLEIVFFFRIQRLLRCLENSDPEISSETEDP